MNSIIKLKSKSVIKIYGSNLALNSSRSFPFIQKRFMMGASGGNGRNLSNIIKKMFPQNTAQKTPGFKQDYATFYVVKRDAPCQKTVPHPGPKHVSEDGKTELREVDHSGKNHYMLTHGESGENSDNLDIHGMFSSKGTPYKGIPPTQISNQTLTGQNQPQYFHPKENTTIEKAAVSEDPMLTEKIQNDPDYIKLCNKIKIDKNLD